jgi:hypothetical protein
LFVLIVRNVFTQTQPIRISVLTAVTNSALNAASVFPSRSIEISDSHSGGTFCSASELRSQNLGREGA